MKKINKYIYPKYNYEIIKKNINIETPAILYDINFLLKSIDNFKKDLYQVNNCELFFAMKANNSDYILNIFKDNNIGIDVANIYEYYKAKEIGFDNISFTSVELDKNILKKIDSDCYINADNKTQLYLLNQQRDSFGVRISLGDNDYSYFGINIMELLELDIDFNKIDTLHFHSDNVKVIDLYERIYIFDKIKNKLPNVKKINMGGGLLSLYQDRVQFLKFIINMNIIYPNLTFIFEPGEALIRYSATLITQVISIKTYKDKNLVFLDSSPWISAPWLKSEPINISSNLSQEDYILHGNSMIGNDIYFEKIVKLNKVKIGDKIIFPEYGAYTLSNYRSFHLLPKPQSYYIN